MNKCKTKATQTDLDTSTHIPVFSDTFRHILTESSIFMNYSSILRTLCNPGIFRTLAYSEPCESSTMNRFVKIVGGNNCFRNTLSVKSFRHQQKYFISFPRWNFWPIMFKSNYLFFFNFFLPFTFLSFEVQSFITTIDISLSMESKYIVKFSL